MGLFGLIWHDVAGAMGLGEDWGSEADIMSSGPCRPVQEQLSLFLVTLPILLIDGDILALGQYLHRGRVQTKRHAF